MLYGHLERNDRRLARAQAVTAHIMRAIEKHMPNYDEDNLRCKLTNEILALLHADGIEVLTDFDRAQMGLPTRDERGWTEQEIVAHDLMMTQIMLSPRGVVVATDVGRKGSDRTAETTFCMRDGVLEIVGVSLK